jgi:anti-anti-sigma regulatory factor
MLRVTILETSTEQKFVLEGKLTEPWVSDLESAWNSTRQARRGRMCIVDLRDITLVDESGKRILAAMCSEGVQFIVRGVNTRCLVEELEKEAHHAYTSIARERA